MNSIDNIDIVVIGAGHAGLAVSRLLTEAGREHVVLDRGRVAERWRTERWDSLHLLSPNWMNRLPGWEAGESDPDGFMSGSEFVSHLERYADSFGAPVIGGTTVEELSRAGGHYRVATDRGTWLARNVVIATGPHGSPRMPAGLGTAHVLTSNHYRNPARLPSGGVLVVGASASGVQIADELSRAGREVALAVGRHTRVPRHYRGMDVFWWLQSTGRLARTIHEVSDPVAARREPSMQLAGRPGGPSQQRDLDLMTLQARGVRLFGRFDGMEGTRARFRTDLAEHVAAADVRLHRLLDDVDEHIACSGLSAEVLPADRPRRVDVPSSARFLDLARERISTVVVATGFRPDYPWLRLPITAPDGRIRQDQGVSVAPGVYVVGQRFQHRRDSAFIDGARHDAGAVVRHLLTGSTSVVASDLDEEPAA